MTPQSKAGNIKTLLLPKTPHDIAERYMSLSERAANTDFDLLVNDIVVIDTETTGLSFRDCGLIQIAAARMEQGVIAERFNTFVHPKQPIPPEISELTGISNADVADAPPPEKAIEALTEFVGGMPLIAHNAFFDKTFIERVRGGRAVSEYWIDSLALSRIALPRLTSHRLADMASAFGCLPVTHRANDDVDALVGVWPIILQALLDLPDGLLTHLAQMHPEIDWSFRPIFSQLATLGPQTELSFSLKEQRHMLFDTTLRERVDADELQGSLKAPSEDAIREFFSVKGQAEALHGNYEERPEQLAMALEVREALARGTHRAIEAGTGVGKSLAYLLPEILYAQENDITVGVATKTNALTDQLVTHELPALNDVLPHGVTYAALKGYEHYPCLRKLERATTAMLASTPKETGARDAVAAQEMLTALAVTYAFACQSPEGDLDALGIRWRLVPREMLTTTPAECMRGRCPFYPKYCLLHGARRRAAAADVVITNHSLLLRNIMAEGRILPPVRNWVIDEAHAFEAEARRQWAREYDTAELRRSFEQLGGTKSGAIRSVLVRTTTLDGGSLYTRLLTKLSAASSRAQIACSELTEALHGLVELADGGAYDQVVLWIDAKLRESSQWEELTRVGWQALEHLDEANKDLVEAVEALSQESAQLASELAESGAFLHELAQPLKLVLEGDDSSYVYSAELSRHRQINVSERLVAQKVDVGSDLAARWYPETHSVIYTSATIAVGKSFEHFNHAVGMDLLPKEEHKDLWLSSSFDYDANMAVVLCRDLPLPGSPGYLAMLEELLYDVHVGMGGSVLTLFTNRREMESVYKALKPKLQATGLALSCQERGSSPRRLREQFVADESLSLMALRSFWEGFDAAGDTLRCVVIPKLPFASPKDPLVRERELREDRSWWRYSLPEAIISVKQAAGRLIRSRSDSGVIVLADPRIVTKRYGRQVVQAMPSHNVVELSKSNVRRYLETWQQSRT